MRSRRIAAGSATVVAGAVLALLGAPASEAGTPGTPPANDDFADAQGLLGQSGSISGTINAATKESGEPDHAGNPGGASVWYLWYSGSDQRVIFDTEGSSIDTLLGVYQGDSVGDLTPVGSSDDAVAGEGWSGVQFEAEADDFYVIAVDGFNGGSAPQRGDIVLNWGSPSPPLTKITKKPAKLLKGAKRVKARVAFTASDEDATFECSLDSGAFTPCTSPRTYSIKTTAKPKPHRIRVQALDPYGNADQPPAAAKFRVKRKR